MTLPRSFTSLLAIAFCAAGTSLTAQTATTDPVGMIQIALPGATDSYVYLPFKRTPVFTGTTTGPVTAVTATASKIPLSGSPGIADAQKYYAFLLDGTRAGMYYVITGYDTSSVTVDPSGDSLATLVATGSRLQVIPFDTLGSVMPAGAGTVASTNFGPGGRHSEVYLADQARVGINSPSSDIYFYVGASAGVTAGWRKVGEDTTTLFDDAVLYPDSFFFVRNKAGEASTLTLTGTVAMSTLSAPINLLAADQSQDNAIALPVAVPITLAQSKLLESGAFTASTSRGPGGRKDELYVWDPAASGINRAASRSYYYLNVAVGDGNGPGWRLIGDGDDLVRDTLTSDMVLGPGSVIVVRKKVTGETKTAFWAVKPPYVP